MRKRLASSRKKNKVNSKQRALPFDLTQKSKGFVCENFLEPARKKDLYDYQKRSGYARKNYLKEEHCRGLKVKSQA